MAENDRGKRGETQGPNSSTSTPKIEFPATIKAPCKPLASKEALILLSSCNGASWSKTAHRGLPSEDENNDSDDGVDLLPVNDDGRRTKYPLLSTMVLYDMVGRHPSFQVRGRK